MPEALSSLPWWVLPFVAALILVSIHTYLGLHVLQRKVLFVDLALAQIAALGGSVAFLYGFELADSVTYWVSLVFAVLGAWVFSVARVEGERVPQEAIIGLSFAIASAGSILLSAENPHGAEHLRDILAGSILVVTPREIRNAALLYAAVGAFHWFLRDRFLLISRDPEGAARRGMRVKAWDFLFYASFALVITMSVHIAGVLLVFCLLIAPAVCSALFAESFAARLWIGWGASVLALAGGLGLSARADWPPAPSIICVFAALLVGSAVVRYLRRAVAPARALAQVAAAAVVLLAAGGSMVAFLGSDFAQSLRAGDEHGQAHAAGEAPGTDAEKHSHGAPEHGMGGSLQDLLAALGDEHENVRAQAAEDLGALGNPSALAALERALADPAAAVKEKAAQALGVLGRPESVAGLEQALAVRDEDEWVHLHVAEALCRCGAPAGLTELLRQARAGEAKLVRAEALGLALRFAGRNLVADPDSPEGLTALAEAEAWWRAAAGHARWQEAAGRFVER